MGWNKQPREDSEGDAKIALAKKPLFLYFTDVTEEDLEKLAAAPTKTEAKKILQDCMKIDAAKGLRTEILADMHYHNYSFCVSRGFSNAKISTFLSIMKAVLEEALEKRQEVEESFEFYKQLLLKHGLERPPWSYGIFTFQDVKASMDYVHNTFFRHYRLYMYTYMTHCNLHFATEGGVFVAPPVLPPTPLHWSEEVDPKTQPELASLFKPSDVEIAEAELRRLRGETTPEERAEKVNQKVEVGVKKLMEVFDRKIKEQDEKFQALLG